MAEIGVIGLMISSTATAAGVLGIIKRRCGASERITTLTEKCADQVSSIKELLETLEEGTKLPYDARSISTALNQRCREFKAIEKQLGKVDRRTKRASRTKRFTMAQGWVKKLEGIYDDLQHMRQDVQQLVVSWESRRVRKAAIEGIATIDATRNAERYDGAAIWALDSEECDILVSANNAERIFLTGVKLSPNDWKALSRFGRMDELSLPDALVLAGDGLRTLYFEALGTADRYELKEQALQYSRHSIRLLRLAAELRKPEAHHRLGWIYWIGLGTEVDHDSSALHLKIALDSGQTRAAYNLSELYDCMDEPEMAVKYLIRAAEHNIDYSAEIVLRLTMGTGNVHDVEEARKWLRRCPEPLFHSFCHFFGIAVEKSERESVRFAEKLKVDDTEYRVSVVNVGFSPEFRMISHSPYSENARSVWLTLQGFGNGSKPLILKEWIDHLFDNRLQSMVLSLLQAGYSSMFGKGLFEFYAERAAREGMFVAHLLFAQHFTTCCPEYQDWRRAEQHLRIAAEMGHSNAQEVCRELFGDSEKASRGITNIDEQIELRRRALQNLSMSAERPPSR